MRITSKGSRKLSTVNASTGINRGARRKGASVSASKYLGGLSAEKRAFARQLQSNSKKGAINASTAIMGGTNTSNIMARPDFLELLPLFVQKLYVLDVFGSVAMNSRSQFVPYFKFVADTTKGETKFNDVLSSPFVNRQGQDPNFTGRVVKNEVVLGADSVKTDTPSLTFAPVLPGSVTIQVDDGSNVKTFTDDAAGNITAADGSKGTINYAAGIIEFDAGIGTGAESVVATYQYDNENIGPDTAGQYGAKMATGRLDLDEINLIAEAHEIACYYSVYSAFATQTEYGANIGDMAKEAAIGELTAEINSSAFALLADTARYNPQFDWDASPVQSGAVVPSDYMDMFLLKLEQAAAAVYQATRLSQPNRLVVGTNVGAYIKRLHNFEPDTATANVGPYRLGKLNQFEIFCDPNYDTDTWVMACKSDDIRRSSALFGEYMPITGTDPVGLADASVQSGWFTMYAQKVVNPDTVVSGRILGAF